MDDLIEDPSHVEYAALLDAIRANIGGKVEEVRHHCLSGDALAEDQIALCAIGAVLAAGWRPPAEGPAKPGVLQLMMDELQADNERLRGRVHAAVDEVQRRYAKYQARCDQFDVWSKWAKERYEKYQDVSWHSESEATRLVVLSLKEENERLAAERDEWKHAAEDAASDQAPGLERAPEPSSELAPSALRQGAEGPANYVFDEYGAPKTIPWDRYETEGVAWANDRQALREQLETANERVARLEGLFNESRRDGMRVIRAIGLGEDDAIDDVVAHAAELFDRSPRQGEGEPAPGEAMWQIQITVPARVDRRNDLWAAVVSAVEDWEPEDRDGWDVNVSGAPAAAGLLATTPPTQPADPRDELLRVIWLYVKWRYVTKQLTTEQKNLWADILDSDGESFDTLPPGETRADRWWNEPDVTPNAESVQSPTEIERFTPGAQEGPRPGGAGTT